MSVPIPRRGDYDAAALRRAAKATKHAAQGRRLLEHFRITWAHSLPLRCSSGTPAG